MINRIIENQIRENLFNGKVVIVYGARQVGKTTLCKKIISDYGDEAGYFNCEILSVREALSVPEPKRIKDYLGNLKLIALDEAQSIGNIGLILKVMIDAYGADFKVVNRKNYGDFLL